MQTALALVAGALVAANLISILLAGRRIAARRSKAPPLAATPPVSIVVPARGIEAFTPETLRQALRIDWPDYELIFCVADTDDPVIAEIEKAAALHPEIPVRVLTGNDRISANPKLNNCVKGWRAARHDWVVLADSNVLMPPDYIRSLLSAWRHDSGLVCSMPIGARPEGFWAELECMFLNTHQARWQYAGEAVGQGFAQGKTMLWHKPLLNAHGGIQALSAEIAEDAAATKLVNRIGRKVHLVALPFEQPLGRRKAQDVWARQCRWARLRRVTFPALFVPEILLGALPPALTATAVALIGGVGPLPLVGGVLAGIYLPEIALAAAKGWRLSLWSLPAMIVRDMMMPAIWIRAWSGASLAWRGNRMTIGTDACELEEAPALR